MSISFGEYFMFLPVMVFLFSFWVVFLKLIHNLNLANTEVEKNKKVINISTPKQNYFFVLVEYYLVGVFTLFLFFSFLRGRNNLVLFNHFVFTEFHIKIFLFFLLVGFSFYFIIRSSVFNKSDYPADFFFSLLNLILFLPFLFCINDFFTFLFILELVSCFLFYKLAASKLWYKNTNDKLSITTSNEKPNLYINMIFFQYWVTFLSTVLLIYAILTTFYSFGTSEWCLFNLVNSSSSILLQTTSNADSLILSIVFVFGILLKLGVAPIHLFKIETYRGVPYLSILFYTTYYFTVIFFMFLCLLDENVISLLNSYYYLLLLLVSLGLFYITALLFDVSYLKTFFAYSTVINSLSFLVLFISRF